MSLQLITMEELRALIERQMAGRAKAEQDAREFEDLLRESLGEFMRRVAPAPSPEAPASKERATGTRLQGDMERLYVAAAKERDEALAEVERLRNALRHDGFECDGCLAGGMHDITTRECIDGPNSRTATELRLDAAERARDEALAALRDPGVVLRVTGTLGGDHDITLYREDTFTISGPTPPVSLKVTGFVGPPGRTEVPR